MLKLFIAGALLELLIYWRPVWPARRYVAVPAVVALSLVGGFWLIEERSLLGALGMVVGMFRMINLLRLAQGRMNEHYLRRAAGRASLILISSLGLIAVLTEVVKRLEPSPTTIDYLTVLAATQVAAAAVILLTALRTIAKTAYRATDKHFSDKELPTVTVAIPARNETASLNECLEAILGNDYPKLEILVLDDCSQDRTPEVIKSFAQAGVRFVRGDPPKTNWLAKNQAYDDLTRHASGEFILFCGADTRLGPRAIRSLVTLLLNRNKQMVSVMPRHVQNSWLASLIQPMRYWWELAVPRRMLDRPAVLSTCWMIRRRILKELGGFAAVSRAVLPEGYFARGVLPQDGYSFVRSSDDLVVESTKDFRDQFDRAIRVRYPEVHRRLELAGLLAAGEATLLLGPFLLIVFGLAISQPVVYLPALFAAVLLTITNLRIVGVGSRLRLWPALVNFPLMVVSEICLILASMLKYEFSTVDWKGRNICLPVMHAVPLVVGGQPKQHRFRRRR